MALHRSIAALKEAHAAATAAQPGSAETGFQLLQSSDLQRRRGLDPCARSRACASAPTAGRSRTMCRSSPSCTSARSRTARRSRRATLPGEMGAEIVPRRSSGEFAPAGGEFRFDVSALARPTRPWVNVLANPDFGAQISEAGGGYSWAVNSRLNQLTPWSNDAVADPAGEWFLLQDLRTHAGLEHHAVGGRRRRRRIPRRPRPGLQRHQPPARRARRQRDLVRRQRRPPSSRCACASSTAATGRCSCASSASPNGSSARNAAIAQHVPHLDGTAAAAPGSDEPPASRRRRRRRRDARRVTALFCTQRDRSAGFGGGTAFFAPRRRPRGPRRLDLRPARDVRRARPRRSFPTTSARPAAARSIPARRCRRGSCCAPATRVDRVFLLGYGAERRGRARAVAERPPRAAAAPPAQRAGALGRAARHDRRAHARPARSTRWSTAGCSTRRSPAGSGRGPASTRPAAPTAFATSCRTRSRSPGPAPAMLRAADRPRRLAPVRRPATCSTGGMRRPAPACAPISPTTCSGCRTPARTTCETTGDASHPRRAGALPRRRRDPRGRRGRVLRADRSARRRPASSSTARARSTAASRSASHGLPLMGTGDWNDGMNRVGHHGKGESVWLAWFLCDVVARFAPVAEAARRGRARGTLARRRARLARRARSRRLGRRLVPARLLRRRLAARLARATANAASTSSRSRGRCSRMRRPRSARVRR